MFPYRERATPDEKAVFIKELPSDIWHPLLLFSLNKGRETDIYMTVDEMAQCYHAFILYDNF